MTLVLLNGPRRLDTTAYKRSANSDYASGKKDTDSAVSEQSERIQQSPMILKTGGGTCSRWAGILRVTAAGTSSACIFRKQPNLRKNTCEIFYGVAGFGLGTLFFCG